ncbi:MAG: hypothetical protein ABR903_10535 [Thermodesulfovibrionales bacterium]
MKEKQLLFVTYDDENFEEGLSYAIDLAKTMHNGIALLLLCNRKVMERFNDLMTVITFAEAKEHKTARERIIEDYKKNNDDYDQKLALLKEKCEKSGVTVEVGAAAMDAVSAIKKFLKQDARIDMVLLSPNVTDQRGVTTKELNRLVKTCSRPIVTMAKNMRVA